MQNIITNIISELRIFCTVSVFETAAAEKPGFI
jgi:hypothetical protein